MAINGPGITASFKYDALNRRVEKTVNGNTTQYLYDGLDIIQEQENGAVKVNYLRTLRIDEVLMRTDATGGIRFYQHDQLGSTVVLTDENGITKTVYSYDPFGNTTMTGEAIDQPFQYTGRENDGTGLYYYRARYYSPEMQRFVQKDPIGHLGGINLYAYVGNNPVNWIDPLGLAPVIIPGGDGRGGCPAGTICMDPGPLSPPSDSPFGKNPFDFDPSGKPVFPFFPPIELPEKPKPSGGPGVFPKPVKTCE